MLQTWLKDRGKIEEEDKCGRLFDSGNGSAIQMTMHCGTNGNSMCKVTVQYKIMFEYTVEVH